MDDALKIIAYICAVVLIIMIISASVMIDPYVIEVLESIKRNDGIMHIKLNTIEKVKEFVTITSKYNEDMFISCGRYIVDAKSILGIFSLNLSNDLKLSIDTNDNAIKEKFYSEIRKFIIEEENENETE